MKPRVRSLVMLVAAVAISLGAVLEIRNHSRRDLQFSKVMSYQMAASWHYREAMHCRVEGTPYPRADRVRVNGDYHPGMIPAPVTGWGAEASFHEEWAERLAERAEIGLRLLEAVDAKLLLH